MANTTDIEPKDNNTILSLVSGILRDASDLISKEIAAAKLEMREEVDKVKAIAALLGVGMVALLIGAILLALALVYVVQEYTALDLWACYAIVGGSLVLLGLIVLLIVRQRAVRTNLIPSASLENAKEDARWITRRVKYDTR